MRYKPFVLVVLDGWGVAPPSKGNAITQAKTPFFKSLLQNFPHSTIQAAGEGVGLPWQEMGNSEVGHMNLGSGRVMYQELPRINRSILDGSFFTNPAFKEVIKHVKKFNSSLHLMGLVSPGGVHSHIDHLYNLLKLAKKEGIKKVYIHAFTDGRDAPRKSAIKFVQELEEKVKEIGVGRIATVSGRWYAMDRDERWDRIKKTYDAMVRGKGLTFSSAIEAIEDSYSQNIFDEQIKPCVIVEDGKAVATVAENDGAIFFNFRSDRARQLTLAFVLPGFEKFERGARIKNLFFVTMTEYDIALPVKIAFPPVEIVNSLGEILSKHNLSQLRIAESEKFAHVTVFFNCGRIEPFKGEARQLVTSPQVATYDQQPEMSAPEVTSLLCRLIGTGKYDFILLNYANADMVGHTGVIPAAVKAIETVDRCLAKVCNLVLSLEGALIICADHGNAEVMINPKTGEVDKEHTANPVPFIIVANDRKFKNKSKDTDLSLFAPIGVLADVAPTCLEFLELEKPEEMTGISLREMI